MDEVSRVCIKHNICRFDELIGYAEQNPKEDLLYVMGQYTLEQEEITKLNGIKDCIRLIRGNDQSETTHDRYIWLKDARHHCELLYKKLYPDSILGISLSAELREPVGFLKIREFVLGTFHEYEDEYLKKGNEKSQDTLPVPKSVAEKFVSRKENTSGTRKIHEITPVMEKTKQYIIKEGILNIDGHVHAINKTCHKMAGALNTRRTWIKFYAKEAGLKMPEDDAM